MTPTPPRRTLFTDFQKKLESALEPLYRQYAVNGQTGSMGTTRWDQVREARRALLFHKGLQYLAEFNDQPNWAPVGDRAVLKAAGLQPSGQTILAYTFNFMTGDVELISSILARATPHAKPTAHDVRQPLPAPTAEVIERALSYYDGRHNNSETKMPVARWFAMLPGGIFSHVQVVADAGRYGTSMEPKIIDVEFQDPGSWYCPNCGAGGEGVVDVCTNCGSLIMEENRVAPHVRKEKGTEQVRVPNLGVEVRFSNLLNTWMTDGAKSIDDATWLVHQDDSLTKGQLLQRFQVQEELIANPTFASSMTRSYSFVDLPSVRALALSSTGQTNPTRFNRYTVTRMWLDPSEYALLNDQSVVDILREYFPDGLRTSWLPGSSSGQPQLIEAIPENMRDCWAVATHDGQPPDASPSPFRPYFDGQMAINDLVNIAIMSAMSSGSLTLVRKDALNAEAIARLRRYPGTVLPVGPNFNRDAIQQLSGTELRGELLSLIERFLTMIREAVGITASVRGNSATGVAREAVINREQSLQALQPWYKQFLGLHIATAANYVRQLARYRLSRIWVPRSAGAEPTAVEIGDLGNVLKTGWRLDVDETLPLSPAEQRQILTDMVPKLAQAQLTDAFGLSDPLNAGTLLSMLGVDNLIVRPAAIRATIESIFETITSAPPPPGLEQAPTDPAKSGEFGEAARAAVEAEQPIVMPNNDAVPLEAAVDIGSFLLYHTRHYRALYRGNHVAWLRCQKYVQVARQMLAEMQPPPGPPSEGPGSGPQQQPNPPGQVPNGDSLPSKIPAAPRQGLPAMSQ